MLTKNKNKNNVHVLEDATRCVQIGDIEQVFVKNKFST